MKDSPFHPVSPERIVAESERAIAFLDTSPLTEGHTLVVSKTVTASLYDLTPEDQAAVWELVRETRDILRAKHHPAGFNIGLNDGNAAGQTIRHAHVHVIPRYKGDVPDPRGGLRCVIPGKARYWE